MQALLDRFRRVEVAPRRRRAPCRRSDRRPGSASPSTAAPPASSSRRRRRAAEAAWRAALSRRHYRRAADVAARRVRGAHALGGALQPRRSAADECDGRPRHRAVPRGERSTPLVRFDLRRFRAPRAPGACARGGPGRRSSNGRSTSCRSPSASAFGGTFGDPGDRRSSMRSLWLATGPRRPCDRPGRSAVRRPGLLADAADSPHRPRARQGGDAARCSSSSSRRSSTPRASLASARPLSGIAAATLPDRRARRGHRGTGVGAGARHAHAAPLHGPAATLIIFAFLTLGRVGVLGLALGGRGGLTGSASRHGLSAYRLAGTREPRLVDSGGHDARRAGRARRSTTDTAGWTITCRAGARALGHPIDRARPAPTGVPAPETLATPRRRPHRRHRPVRPPPIRHDFDAQRRSRKPLPGAARRDVHACRRCRATCRLR